MSEAQDATMTSPPPPSHSKKKQQKQTQQPSAAATATAKPKPKKKKQLSDSWEDESLSESEPDTPTASTTQTPAPPPPTPATPSFLSPGVRSPYSTSTFDQRHNIDRTERDLGRGEKEEERQAKTDAVARRMIANALGVKSRSTAEQKEFDASLKAKVRSEREERKRAEEEMEKAKKAIWDD